MNKNAKTKSISNSLLNRINKIEKKNAKIRFSAWRNKKTKILEKN